MIKPAATADDLKPADIEKCKSIHNYSTGELMNLTINRGLDLWLENQMITSE